MRSKPPFRADHVGSLLRTAPVKDARARFARGEISADDRKAVEEAFPRGFGLMAQEIRSWIKKSE